MSARDEIIATVLANEGGIADVGDGKGLTRFGQTPGWLSQFNLPIPANITEAADNYADWLRLTKLDALIGGQPDDLATIVIDFAVHSGHVTAIRMLQSAIGAQVDGVIGRSTLAALANADRKTVARRVLAGRMEQIGGLIADHPERYARFARGWLRRLGDQVRRLA
jgi:lysozyme family protein